MSIRSLAVIIERSLGRCSVLADTATVTGRGTLHVDGFSEERGLPLATSGDFSWPPAGTSTGHQRGLSHGHGHPPGVQVARRGEEVPAIAGRIACIEHMFATTVRVWDWARSEQRSKHSISRPTPTRSSLR